MNSDIKQLSLLLYNHLQKIYSDPPFPLHRPIFSGNEKEYLTNCIDSNFVSSVGAQVSKLQNLLVDLMVSQLLMEQRHSILRF